MKHRAFAVSLLAGSAVAASFVFAPRPPDQSDITDLFDPAAIARNMCGATESLSTFGIPPAAAADIAPATKIWPGLGEHSFKITTTSQQAQAFFDQGLRLVYGFNFGEALASFRAAQALDPACAMCFWGEAFALGPTLNATMPEANNAPALAAVQKADALAHDKDHPTTPRERGLIAALKERYSDDPHKTREALNAAYADAMYRAYQLFDGDVDMATLHADAALNESRVTGWWTPDGRLPTPRAASALVALERALKVDGAHAGAIHYYIHAMDSSPRPERAEPFANKLAGLMPGAGHIVHMPAHIYYRRGRYIDALNANIDALKVDDAYLGADNSADNVYRYQLYAHNLHFGFASANMAGDEKNALALAGKLDALLARGVVQRPDYYAAAAYYPRVRFASSKEILALPAPADTAIFPKGIWHYARASAFVAAGDLNAARAELAALERLRKETDLEKMLMSYSRTPQMLLLAEEVVRGRIAAQEKNWDEAFKHFAAAITVQGQVRGFDPPAWDFPVKQALGLALLKAGRTEDAMKVLREALMDAPNNATVLYALAQASEVLKDSPAASQYRLLYKRAWAGRDAPDLNRI